MHALRTALLLRTAIVAVASSCAPSERSGNAGSLHCAPQTFPSNHMAREAYARSDGRAFIQLPSHGGTDDVEGKRAANVAAAGLTLMQGTKVHQQGHAAEWSRAARIAGDRSELAESKSMASENDSDDLWASEYTSSVESASDRSLLVASENNRGSNVGPGDGPLPVSVALQRSLVTKPSPVGDVGAAVGAEMGGNVSSRHMRRASALIILLVVLVVLCSGMAYYLRTILHVTKKELADLRAASTTPQDFRPGAGGRQKLLARCRTTNVSTDAHLLGEKALQRSETF